jgi:hypothetical protein
MTIVRIQDPEGSIAPYVEHEGHEHPDAPPHAAHDAAHHEHHAPELVALRAALDDEHHAHRLQHERESTALRTALDAELHAHMQLRSAYTQLETQSRALADDAADARRAVVLRTTALSARGRELEDLRRSLQAEQAKHRATVERLAAADSGHAALTETRAELHAQRIRHAAELEALQARLASELQAQLTADARIDALAEVVALSDERTAAATLALSQEIADHDDTRRRLGAVTTAKARRRCCRWCGALRSALRRLVRGDPSP